MLAEVQNEVRGSLMGSLVWRAKEWGCWALLQLGGGGRREVTEPSQSPGDLICLILCWRSVQPPRFSTCLGEHGGKEDSRGKRVKNQK